MPPNSSLLQWLATFKLDGNSSVEIKKDAYYNLADGYVCARVLNQISPLYFPDKWLEGIKPVPPNGSWRFRVSNLKRILVKIDDYASELQNPQFKSPSTISPDLVVIAQNFDPDQISRLIQLILFVAINCDKKQDYIEKIRDLPTEVKQDIKEAIEELLVKNDSNLENTFDRSRNNSTLNDGDSSYPSSQRNLNSSSQTAATSLGRFSGQMRRNSSQSEVLKKNESYLNCSSQNLQDKQDDTIEEVRQKLTAALLISDEKSQACHELELKLKQVQMERDQLAYENEKLAGDKSSSTPIKLSKRQSRGNLDDEIKLGARNADQSDLDKENSQELVLQQNQRLRSELQKLKEEIMKIETEREEYRLKSNLLKEDLDILTFKHEDLQTKANQAKRLQDELDEHKHNTEKMVNYQAVTDNLVKKNNELKRELKSYEEKISLHIQNIVKLEEENQQLKNTIDQIEIYKKQLNEARVKLSLETHRADKAEVELSRLTDKFEATKKDCDRLLETALNQQRRHSAAAEQPDEIIAPHQSRPFGLMNSKDGSELVEKLDGSDSLVQQHQQQQQHGGNDLNSISSNVIEFRERVARLETENELLRSRLEAKQETNKSVLTGFLEEATEKCKKLEFENRLARKQIMLLECNLKDLKSHSKMQPTTAANQSNIYQHHQQQQESSSDNVMALIKQVEDLRRTLYQRDQELREAEVKYKKNIQKAKDAINYLNSNQSMNGPGGSLHPSGISSASSFNSNSLDEVSLLKQQLREREERLIDLEREFHEYKKVKEVHERLILSAFYGLTTPIQWRNAEKRLERTTLTSPPNTTNTSVMSMGSKHSH